MLSIYVSFPAELTLWNVTLTFELPTYADKSQIIESEITIFVLTWPVIDVELELVIQENESVSKMTSPFTRTLSQCVGVKVTPGIWIRAVILAFWLFDKSKQMLKDEKLARYWEESNAATSSKGVTLKPPVEAISTETLPLSDGGEFVEKLTEAFDPA